MLVAHVEANPQVSFDFAAEDTGLRPELLRKLVRDGVLAGFAFPRVELGTVDLAEARRVAAQLAEARRPVEGQGILATVAAKKYGLSDPSIYRWHEAGWITVVRTTESGDKLFNEGDIAFARCLADLIGHKAGKAVFPYKKPTGRPPKK